MNDLERWRADPEQAREDDWAVRILLCPNAGCRRQLRCTEIDSCPALERYPNPEGTTDLLVGIFRQKIVERHTSMHAGPEAEAARRARWARKAKRRNRLAFERARKKLGMG